jgi:hypothetical protein
MRTLFIALVLLAAAVAAGPLWRTAAAAGQSHAALTPAIAAQSQELPSENDDRVEVQLTVLGIALGMVFVAGTAAYLLRRRLGLTAYAPPKDSGRH